MRPAAPDDRPGIEAVVQVAYGKYVERIGKPPAPLLDDYQALIERGAVTVIEAPDGTIAAAIVLLPQADHLLLDNIAVHPEWQGQGYGRRLFSFAERQAARLGFREIRLYTHVTMIENIALYGRWGFEETDRGTQAGYARVFMRKRLS